MDSIYKMQYKLKRHPSVKAYVQHGFLPVNETDSEIVGQCPFCGYPKMSVNKENKNWQCFHGGCKKHGGYQTFLQQMNIHCQEQLTKDKLNWLSRSRNIPSQILKSYKTGYNDVKKHYTLPVNKLDGDGLADLRMFTNGRLVSTYGCKSGLWNSESLKGKNQTVWLCEGEWDGMVFAGVAPVKDAVIAVPGARVMKPDWKEKLKGKKIRVLYDHDKDGQEGSLKLYRDLKPVVKELLFLNWPEKTPNKFDIRDLYKREKKPQKVFDFVNNNLKDAPQGLETEKEKVRIEKEIFTGEGLQAEDVYRAYERWLHVPDRRVIDALYGTIIANRLDGYPLWLFIVAPPGMTKTEYLSSLADAKAIESVSTLTPHALVSGTAQGQGDPSLIPKLDGKVLIIKDFTTILQMNQQAREEVFGTLRDAYDGEITKIFGNHVTRFYKSKFGIVAGVTHAIEQALEQESVLGERFLRWEMRLPESIDDQMEYIKRAADNVNEGKTMKDDLREIAFKTLNYPFVNNVNIPDKLSERIMYLSMWVALMRGTILRDRWTKEITSRPFIEIGTRLSQQLTKFLYGLSMFKRITKPGYDEYDVVKSIAKSTVSGKVGYLIEPVFSACKDRSFTAGEVRDIVKLPLPVVKRNLENAHILKILSRDDVPGSKPRMRFTDDFHRICDLSGVYD